MRVSSRECEQPGEVDNIDCPQRPEVMVPGNARLHQFDAGGLCGDVKVRYLSRLPRMLAIKRECRPLLRKGIG